MTNFEICISGFTYQLVLHAPEIKEIPRVDEINRYLDRMIEEVKAEIARCPKEHKPDWQPLNKLFLETINLT